MGDAENRIRISDRVRRELESRRRSGESYNDVLQRILVEDTSDFEDGFGRWSDEEADCVRKQHQG